MPCSKNRRERKNKKGGPRNVALRVQIILLPFSQMLTCSLHSTPHLRRPHHCWYPPWNESPHLTKGPIPPSTGEVNFTFHACLHLPGSGAPTQVLRKHLRGQGQARRVSPSSPAAEWDGWAPPTPGPGPGHMDCAVLGSQRAKDVLTWSQG